MCEDILIIQSFFIRKKDCSLSSKAGFISPEFNWMSWALSCLQLRKYYNKVELYTNETGKQILIDLFKLPYTTVHVIDDNIIPGPSNLFICTKLYVYSLQKKPFIHVDGDVYIWDKFKISNSAPELFVQNIEDTHYYYRKVYDSFEKHQFKMPNVILQAIGEKRSIKSINAGIIGGCNLDFFSKYVRLAFNFMEINRAKLETCVNIKFNMIFEQHLFYCLAEKENLTITTHFNNAVTNMTYSKLVRFPGEEYENSYLHIVGKHKENIDICVKMAKQLRRNYPDFYSRIINACQVSGTGLILSSKNVSTFPKLSENYIYKGYRKINWSKLYDNEIIQQNLLENVFGSLSGYKNIKFKTSSLLSKLRQQVRNGTEVFTRQVPCSMLRAYKTVELDVIDEAMIKVLRTPQTYDDLCRNLGSLFDESELRENPKAFFRLIFLKLKNGCIEKIFAVIHIS